jgi:FtsP/CotA-like multicopper oxidase with cupredoxin domain
MPSLPLPVTLRPPQSRLPRHALWLVTLVPTLAFGSLAASRSAAPRAPKRDANVEPPVLANTAREPNTVEVTITAAAATIEVQPGVKSRMMAYNGTVPGPTLDVHEGDRVIVHFRNNLSEPTTVHWHGLHIPVDADGSPLKPIAPGASHDYVFTLKPGSAGTYWYHPHPHMSTGNQVAKGCAPTTIRYPHRSPSD